MKRIKVDYEEIWSIAGVVEELRNAGVCIPAELDRILHEDLLKRNFAVYVRDVYPARTARMLEILESMEVPDAVADEYGGAAEQPMRDAPQLAPFRTEGFLTDRVLGVGLKSYPYVMDCNGDGRKDLLVGDHDGFIYLYLNENTDEDPVFGRGERLKAVDTGESLICQLNPKMSFGDLTGNGSLDIVLGNNAGTVAFIPNRATDGTLQYAMADARNVQTRSGDLDAGRYAYPELVDWAGTGRLDLVVGNVEGDLILFRNLGQSGEPLFGEGEKIPGIEPVMYPCAFFVDWDGDGRKDMILGHREGTVFLYRNVGGEGEPRFEKHDVARHADGRPVDVGLLSHPVAVDWNNNGKFDLVVGNDPGMVTVFLNVGSESEPVFDEGRRLKDGGGELIMGVHSVFAFSDFNGDGRQDLIVGHEEEVLRIFPNVGTPTRPEFDDFHIIEDIVVSRERLAAGDPAADEFWANEGLRFNTEYLGNLAPCPVDWRNRGRLDMLVGNYTGLFYLFENTGTRQAPRFAGGIALRMGKRLMRVAGFSTPIICDWNNDGKKDIVSGDLAGRIHVLLNTGTDEAPAFESDLLVTIAGQPVSLGPRSIVEVADITGDGRKDLIVGNRLGLLYVLLNVGTDAEPRFDAVEQVRDDSPLWRELRGGCQFALESRLRESYGRLPDEGRPRPMNVRATSCPRVVDYDNDGNTEMLISQRYGRVFIYGKLPRGE